MAMFSKANPRIPPRVPIERPPEDYSRGSGGANVGPGGDVALAIVIVSHGHHSAVAAQAYGVIVSCGNSHNIPSAADVALAKDNFPLSYHGSVPAQAYGVIVSSGNQGNLLHFPGFLGPLRTIPIIS